MTNYLDVMRGLVRRYMSVLAGGLDRLSGGRITPAMITLTGLAAHLPIAWLMASGHNVAAAIFLVIFGLFDSLDGALARLQKTASSAGMLLDASTDRIKEIFLYSAAAWIMAEGVEPRQAVWAVLALGGSFLVSYVKAKGETAVAGGRHSPNEVNRLFADGFMRFEVRMSLLILGLLTGHLYWALIAIAEGSMMTGVARLYRISKYLKKHAES